MDLSLFNVLEKSGYLVYLGYFAVNNWTRDRLLRAKDLEKVMDEILPKKIPRRQGVIADIITELKSSEHDFRAEDAKKEEELDIPISSTSSIQDDVLVIERTDDAEDVTKEEELDIPISGTSSIQDDVLVIERTDDEIIVVEDNDEGDTDIQMNDADISSISVQSKIFSSKRGNVRYMLLLPENPHQSRTQGGAVSPKRVKPCDKIDYTPSILFEQFTEKRYKKLMATLDMELSNEDGNSTKSWSDWTRVFVENGEDIDFLVCKSWTWKPITEECPLNLLHLLTNVCPQVEELYIRSECTIMTQPLAVNPKLELKNLKILVINHDNHNGLLDYHEILAAIITAAGGNLEEIAFLYQDEVALKRFLDILTNLRREYLANLIYLRIARWDDWHIALWETDLHSLAGINTDQLIYLDLQLGFWDNVQSPFEEMLIKFANLHFLSIQGCFVTGNEVEPQITIAWPHMRNLKKLSIGQHYIFSSVFEDTGTRPAKRRERNSRVGEERPNAAVKRQRGRSSSNLMDDEIGLFFSVALNFGSMRQLTHLYLGALYELHHLPFADMPSLRSFRVCSEWHCLSQFKDRIVFPNIKELQFPDYFQDHSLVPRMLRYFPKVERVHMNLPTVKSIRSFANYAQEIDSLKHLELQVQFDFESSLDSIFLEEVCTKPLTPVEAENLKVLKAYPEWKEYARINKIEVPEFTDEEDVSIVEDKTKFAGLHVLQKKLRNGFNITFVPRTLRLPKGNYNWNDDECEFTDTLIGFREDQYIFTKKAWDKVPYGIKLFGFNLSEVKAATFVYDKKINQSGDPVLVSKNAKKENTEDTL